MEREKKRKSSKWELEVIRNRPLRTKTKRKNKYCAQISLGVILGLMIGLMMESNIFIHRGNITNDSICKFHVESSFPQVSKIQVQKQPHFNEDPLKIIGSVRSDPTRKSLVFVGVMTAQKYISTRAVAVYETWGRELPGKIAFFSSEISKVPKNRKDLPLVRLKTVDDSYPPQKKSFMMLQYMWENYGDRFEWFIRADDDVYIRSDKLESFLRSIDSRKPLFIGQAGRGNQEEFGLLSLEFDENFCMGGPGIIMSRETLKRIAPHIRYCLKNLYTTHEDVELGRCVRRFADISCTWSYEMQTILYHNSSGYEAFTGNLKQKEVNKAITLHPVKQYQYMYRLHNYMRQLKIQKLQHEVNLLQRDMKRVLGFLSEKEPCNLCQALNKNRVGSEKYLGDIHMTGLEPSIQKFVASSEEEVLTWDFMQRSVYSETNLNPRRRIEAPYKEGVEDVIREEWSTCCSAWVRHGAMHQAATDTTELFMEMINQFSRQRGRVIDYQDLLYGYWRVNPLHGADYIFDMLLKYKKYRGRKMTVPVRRHAYLQQQFTGIEIREILVDDDDDAELPTGLTNNRQFNPFKKEIDNSLIDLKRGFPSLIHAAPKEGGSNTKKIINFILPLSGRHQIFLRFLKNYEEVCLMNDKFTSLVVVLFQNSREDADEKIILHIDKLKSKYPQSLLKVVPVKDNFARALALEIGSAHCKDDESNILLYIDVDMVFNKETLERIRRNTIRDRQVYFPIIYSEFDPSVVYDNVNLSSSPNHFLINYNTGYWRQFGFGIASVYKKDLKKAGGFNTSIRGWGKEDVDLYEKFISLSGNITIFRSADPTLIHIFHLVDCDPNLESSQLKMCKGTRKDTYGSVDQLAHCIYDNSHSFRAAVIKKRRTS